MKYIVEVAYMQRRDISVGAANEDEAIRKALAVVKEQFTNARAAVAVSVREAGTTKAKVVA